MGAKIQVASDLEAPEIETAFGLSARQLQVARLAATGLSNREIASELKLTEQIVKNALHSAFDKLGIWNRVELANYFLRDECSSREFSLRRIEAERLSVLEQCNILDTKAEGMFDELANIAAVTFDVPIALVAFADPRRLWFKSNIGLNVSEVPREITICHHTIQQSKVLLISDALKDPRWVCNPLIKEVGVRFYAAAPILKDGYALGVVCIVDRKPREFSSSQLAVLQSLAKVAADIIDLRQSLFGNGRADASSDPSNSKAHDESILRSDNPESPHRNESFKARASDLATNPVRLTSK